MTYHVRGEEGRRERLRQELREERNESDARGERREREREIIGKVKINLKLVATSYSDQHLASCQKFLDISSQIKQFFSCLKC